MYIDRFVGLEPGCRERERRKEEKSEKGGRLRNKKVRQFKCLMKSIKI